MGLKKAEGYYSPHADKGNKATSTSGKGKNYTSKSLSVNDHVGSTASMAKQLSSKSK